LEVVECLRTLNPETDMVEHLPFNFQK
jgi:hypothetical protein